MTTAANPALSRCPCGHRPESQPVQYAALPLQCFLLHQPIESRTAHQIGQHAVLRVADAAQHSDRFDPPQNLRIDGPLGRRESVLIEEADRLFLAVLRHRRERSRRPARRTFSCVLNPPTIAAT